MPIWSSRRACSERRLFRGQRGALRRSAARARAEAARSGRSALDVLEERSGLDARELVRHLARALGYDAASMADLEQAASGFEALPYPDAAPRLRADPRRRRRLALAFGDPFAADLRAWAEERIAEPFEWRLAHPRTSPCTLSRHEEGLRAMDGMVGAAAARRRHRGEGRRPVAGLDQRGCEPRS